jgi:hypothetical protein
MAGKARVHELAKELGVPSKDVLARLAADGVWVRSASSTVEAPVARRLRESFGVAGSTNAGGKAREQASKPAAVSPALSLDQPKPEYELLTTAALLDVGARYRRAQATDNPISAIDGLLEESRDTYGITTSRLRGLLDKEQRRRPAQDADLRIPGSPGSKARLLERQERLRPSGTTDAVQFRTAVPDGAHSPAVRQRLRTPDLPSIVTTESIEVIADIVARSVTSHDRDVIVSCLQELTPNPGDGYGYLTWRYASTLSTAPVDPKLTAAQHELMTLGIVIDYEKRLLDSLVRDHGSILTQPALAKSAMVDRFRELVRAGGTGRSAADELSRTRASFEFLRRALVLTIASGEDNKLWDVLGSIQPSVEQRLTESNSQLDRAVRRLAAFIATVERLLITEEADLAVFIRQSRAHLISLQLRRYDFLRRFRDVEETWTPPSRPTSAGLTFEVLPQGEQLRAFLGEIRRSKRYSGHRVDEHRLTVLEDLEKHFGAHRCVWHKGAGSSNGIDNRYLVLAIKSTNGFEENAVAISPLAGQHATYVVRRECAEADWKTLFAHPKFEARLMGARKLLFTPSSERADPYRAMFAKVINLLQCHPSEFRQGPGAQRRRGRYRR